MKTNVITTSTVVEPTKHFNYTLAFNQILEDLEADYKAGLISVMEFAERKDQLHNFLNGFNTGTTTIQDVIDVKRKLNPVVKNRLFKKLDKGITVTAGNISGKLQSKAIIEGKMYFVLTDGIKINVEDVKSIKHEGK